MIAPDAEVERNSAEGRPDAAVDIDLLRRVICEGNTFGGRADIKLHVLMLAVVF